MADSVDHRFSEQITSARAHIDHVLALGDYVHPVFGLRVINIDSNDASFGGIQIGSDQQGVVIVVEYIGIGLLIRKQGDSLGGRV